MLPGEGVAPQYWQRLTVTAHDGNNPQGPNSQLQSIDKVLQQYHGVRPRLIASTSRDVVQDILDNSLQTGVVVTRSVNLCDVFFTNELQPWAGSSLVGISLPRHASPEFYLTRQHLLISMTKEQNRVFGFPGIGIKRTSDEMVVVKLNADWLLDSRKAKYCKRFREGLHRIATQIKGRQLRQELANGADDEKNQIQVLREVMPEFRVVWYAQGVNDGSQQAASGSVAIDYIPYPLIRFETHNVDALNQRDNSREVKKIHRDCRQALLELVHRHLLACRYVLRRPGPREAAIDAQDLAEAAWDEEDETNHALGQNDQVAKKRKVGNGEDIKAASTNPEPTDIDLGAKQHFVQFPMTENDGSNMSLTRISSGDLMATIGRVIADGVCKLHISFSALELMREPKKDRLNENGQDQSPDIGWLMNRGNDWSQFPATHTIHLYVDGAAGRTVLYESRS
eukprot:Clim_evm8s144 gene=Clim_evmTU8s144